MNRINEKRYVIRIHMLVNTMAKIKDMTVAMTELLKNQANFPSYGIGTAIKHSRVHIALQGNLVADPRSCLVNRQRPVQPHTITITGYDLFKPVTTILGKQNHRNLAPFMFPDQTADNFFHIVQ